MFSIIIPVPTIIIYILVVIAVVLIAKWVLSWLTG